jgi:hypothetical protein
MKIPGVKVQAVNIDILHEQKDDGVHGGNHVRNRGFLRY